jgi:GxxExxY protein
MVPAPAFGMENRDPLTERIIGCAIEVHRHMGAGLLEKPYTLAMCIELARNGIRFERERVVPLIYKDVRVGEYRPDLIVGGRVVVEVKSVLHLEPVFAQMLTYLRITNIQTGLILNFNRPVLREGIKRFVLSPPLPSGAP